MYILICIKNSGRTQKILMALLGVVSYLWQGGVYGDVADMGQEYEEEFSLYF